VCMLITNNAIAGALTRLIMGQKRLEGIGFMTVEEDEEEDE